MNKFDKILDQNYDFEMSKYLKEGWALFSKGAGSLIGFIIMVFAISFILNLIPFVNFLGSFIQTALMAGVFIFCRNLMNKKEDFTDFFKGFNSFGQLALYLISLIVFFIPVLFVFFYFIFPFELVPDIMSGDVTTVTYAMEELADKMSRNMPAILLVYLLLFIAAMYIYISVSFAVPLIVDAKLDFWTAIKTSRAVIGKQFFSFLMMYIILFFLAIFGIIFTCGLGILVIVPYFSCINFVAYDSIMKPHTDDLTSDLQAFGSAHKDVNTESEDNS